MALESFLRGLCGKNFFVVATDRDAPSVCSVFQCIALKGGLIQIPKIDALEERLVEQSPAFEGRLFRGRVLLVRFSHEL